jgi:hypothetical protein
MAGKKYNVRFTQGVAIRRKDVHAFDSKPKPVKKKEEVILRDKAGAPVDGQGRFIGPRAFENGLRYFWRSRTQPEQ